MSRPRVLLVNPPIHDFSAYDYWLKPYGLLRVSGQIRNSVDLELFDFLDRQSRLMPLVKRGSDPWGRGEFYSEPICRPDALVDIPRKFHRFGIPRVELAKHLAENDPYDYALIQTTMTYWYPALAEVIEDLRRFSPDTKIVLGGSYATLMPEHARNLGADFVLAGVDVSSLWHWMGVQPDPAGLPFWDGYQNLETGVLKLSDGCPFKCTYCSVPSVYPPFLSRPLSQSLDELDYLVERGADNIAFYDDALLYQKDRILEPFLDAVIAADLGVHFHTPNALNARFVDHRLAEKMVAAGFKTFYLGFESASYEWQKKTGSKVYAEEFADCVSCLNAAGIPGADITAYLIIAHPNGEAQNVEDSMEFAHSLGIRVMLSEFSPIPGTPDGELCRSYVDLDEPLWHNKTVFPIRFLGEEYINGLKRKSREMNRRLVERVSRVCASRVDS